MVTPDRRRIAVERLQAGFGVSESGVPCGGPGPFDPAPAQGGAESR